MKIPSYLTMARAINNKLMLNKIITRAIHKILLVLIIISFCICNSIGQRDTAKIDLIKPIHIKSIQASEIYNEIPLRLLNTLEGCLCDPVIRNESGISIIESLKFPNAGIGLDFNPLYFNNLKADFLFRSDLSQGFIFNSGLETKYLRGLPTEFRFEYNRYNISKSSLHNYYQYLIGPIYSVDWASIGLLVGQDNYQAKRKIEYEMFFKYELHKATGKRCNPYKSIAVINTTINLWKNKFNYKIKIDYLLNYSISLGFGYEKIYDLNELLITFRYLTFYY